MTYLIDHPYLFGILFGLALAAAIEFGQKTALHARIQEDPHRKEQMVAIRDGLFVLVSLLLGFTLALAVPRFTERRTLSSKKRTQSRLRTCVPPCYRRPTAITPGTSWRIMLTFGSIWMPRAWMLPAWQKSRSAPSNSRGSSGKTSLS